MESAGLCCLLLPLLSPVPLALLRELDETKPGKFNSGVEMDNQPADAGRT